MGDCSRRLCCPDRFLYRAPVGKPRAQSIVWLDAAALAVAVPAGVAVALSMEPTPGDR